MRALLIFGVLLGLGSASILAEELPRDGDIIFQYSQSKQCAAISAATHSPYTHVGLIFYEGGRPLVYEAVQPVVKTPLASWIQRGRNGHYVIKRLAVADQTLRPEVIARLKKEAETYLGKDYDWAFGWSDDRIYCSELVWKVYQRTLGLEVGSLKKLKDFDLENPVVSRVVTERYGKNVPLDETVISPKDVFDSKLLIEAIRKN